MELDLDPDSINSVAQDIKVYADSDDLYKEHNFETLIEIFKRTKDLDENILVTIMNHLKNTYPEDICRFIPYLKVDKIKKEVAISLLSQFSSIPLFRSLSVTAVKNDALAKKAKGKSNTIIQQIDLKTIYYAIKNDDIETVKAAAEQIPKFINQISPIFYQHSNHEIFQFLYNNIPDINPNSCIIGVVNNTKNPIEIFKFLLSKGANVNFQNKKTRSSPLHIAASTNRLEVAKFLLSIGADPKLTNKEGQTPLSLARTDEMRSIIMSHWESPNLSRPTFEDMFLFF